MDPAVASSSYICAGRPTIGDPTIPQYFFLTEVPPNDEEKCMGVSQENPFYSPTILKLQGYAVAMMALSNLGSD